jgi:serine/threonine protein kinase/Tfp pilus assembly protein PilF
MGEVYLAHDTSLRRSAAIKLLPAHLADSTDSIGRIEREACAASSLNHPNILTVYETATQDGTGFIATEFIEGESLRQRIQRGRLELREALDIGVQAASALAAAHAAGIVHRDIKPENLMIRKDGLVKVLDFGLAKVVGSLGRPSDPEARTIAGTDTAPGVVRGTVNYMSPEQARGLETDQRTDVWSLGVLLYELLTGRSTFDGKTTSDVIAAILTGTPPPLTKYTDDAPPELQRIVTKALQKDREERYQAIQDLGLDLKALRRQLDFDADRARQDVIDRRSRPDGASERSRPLARRPMIVSLAAVAIAALASVAYFAYFRATPGRNIDSIAVLPFVNETGDPETEYLSDGISVSLINSLSELSGIKVIARTSAFTYKGKEIDPPDVARALGVKAIVTGRITQRGDDLSIGVELIDVADRTQMWGEEYHRKAADLLKLQGEISGEIADTLHRRLTAAERGRLEKQETTNLQAYDLVLRGRFYFDKGGTQNRKIAIEHYERALAIDPGYAVAYVSLAQAYQYLSFLSVANPEEFIPKAEAAVRKALELDDSLAEAHNALGNVKRYSWDWPGAERAFKRAISLNTNLAVAHDGYANFLSNVGRHEEAVAEGRRAKELDPLSLGFSTRLGLTLLFARRHDEAIDALKQSLVMDPASSVPYLFFGYNYAAKGLFAEAVAAYLEAIRLGDDSASAQIYLGAAYAHSGDRARAQAILKRLQTSGSYVSPGELAILYAALGQREQAFTSLEKAFDRRDVQLVYLGTDPAFDDLRHDPRFEDLIRRVGLPTSALAPASVTAR